nr:hypothetical protein [Marinicella sp. W31]MDC2877707.1 hypothetical protein [Marinicella sp. W31]
MTAGRCLFENNRGQVFVLREGRELPHIEIGPGAWAVWDGRFRIENQTQAELHVAPAGLEIGSEGDYANVPPRLARLATATRPAMMPDAAAQGTLSEVYLAPFDRFLSGFDLEPASTMAVAFGHTAYRSPAEAYLR